MAFNFMDKTGSNIDMDQIETGALLHDIGRTKTHTIRHAIVGAEILKNLNYPVEILLKSQLDISVREFPPKEAEILGLPPGDYMPNTLEEKIVAHADNLINGSLEVDLEFVIEKWEKKFGKDHPAIIRLKKFTQRIKSLRNWFLTF